MPIYEYACGNCEHTLDALQKMSDDPLRDCPECGEAQLKRLISAPRFRLKGSGWYETDFKKDNQRNVLKDDGDGGKADGKEKPDGKDKKEGKSESPSKEKSGTDKKAAAKTAEE